MMTQKKNEQRNARIIELFKEDQQRSHNDLATMMAEEGVSVSRDVIGGVIKRAVDRGELTVAVDRRKYVVKKRPAKRNRGTAQATVPPWLQKKITRHVEPEPCLSIEVARLMAEAILNLKPDQCRWPVPPSTPFGFKFCGCSQKEGSSYCEDHHTCAHAGRNANGKK